MGLLRKSNHEEPVVPQKEAPRVVSAPVEPTIPIIRKNTMANNINEINRIAADTKFTGDLATRTDIRIDGTFEGRLFCDARVVVGEKAIIKGDIFCTFIDFNGTMLGGNFYVKDTLSLKAGCSVQGDLYFQKFQVELDAKYAGKCQMIGEAEFNKVSAPVAAMLQKA